MKNRVWENLAFSLTPATQWQVSLMTVDRILEEASYPPYRPLLAVAPSYAACRALFEEVITRQISAQFAPAHQLPKKPRHIQAHEWQ